MKYSHSYGVWSLVFSPDSSRLAAATGMYTSPAVPGQVKVWDARTGDDLFTFRGHSMCVWDVAFSPDGRCLASVSGRTRASGGLDSQIKIWDLTAGQELATLRGQEGSISGVAYSPDGTSLASMGYNGQIYLWGELAMRWPPFPAPP